MSQTIGKRKPRTLPKGDYVAMCAYCGANWYRSKLRKDGAGHLYCPDEGDGLDGTTLNEMNSKAAIEHSRRSSKAARPAGPYVTETGKKVRITSAEEISNPTFLDEFP